MERSTGRKECRHGVRDVQMTSASPLLAGLEDRAAVPPCVMVVFGASGDLSARKLLPALRQLALRRELPGAFALVGVARTAFDVFLRVRGTAAEHLAPLVAQWTRPFLSIVVWCPSRLPRSDHPLLSGAHEVLVDPDSGATSSLTHLVELSHRFPVTDLTWVRLTPWRELVAGLFMGDDFSPFLRGVDRVEAAGGAWPRLLLAGWMMSRLQVEPTVVRLIEADRPAVRVFGRHRGRRGSFTVARFSDGDEIHATATIEGGLSHRRTLLLPRGSLARVVDRALTHVGRDDVWEQSLAAALELASPP
jgi:glucose-6-phosphate dehydrogenase assembly protein OpcA